MRRSKKYYIQNQKRKTIFETLIFLCVRKLNNPIIIYEYFEGLVCVVLHSGGFCVEHDSDEKGRRRFARQGTVHQLQPAHLQRKQNTTIHLQPQIDGRENHGKRNRLLLQRIMNNE